MDAANFGRTNLPKAVSPPRRVLRIRGFQNLERSWLLPALLLIASPFLGGYFWYVVTTQHAGSNGLMFLLPWVCAAILVIIAPSVVLYFAGKFDLFNPLVFAAWSYFLPAFGVGGLLLTFGLSRPYFMHLIENPEYDLPLTYVYIALGYVGMSVGFIIPGAKRAGEWISRKGFPKFDWKPEQVLLPSVLLLFAGTFFYYFAWLAGTVGYRLYDASDPFNSVTFFLQTVSLEATMLLWLFVFKSTKLKLFDFISLVLLMGLITIRMMLAGNKGTLIMFVIVIFSAFVYSGRKFMFRHAVTFGVVGMIAMFVGVVYGTTFRNQKGGEDRTSLTEYLSYVDKTLFVLSTRNPFEIFGDGIQSVADRIETGSSLAVVVANYEKLQPYEAAYGLDNNIWRYTWTAFIPRFMWNDKPLISDARAYSDLYFNYGDNSFAITPMGDLLRNYGPWGVPLGMMLLGFFMRIVYVALIENQPPNIGRAAMYYMMIYGISFESFYGTILPSVLRTGAIGLLALLLVDLIIGRAKKV